MIKLLSESKHLLTCILVVLLAGTIHAQAQAQRGTATGGPTRSTGSGGGGSSSRQYYSNGMVGEATISSDPETRRLIVITDDETSRYVTQVVTNLDRPKPQVLIKVVFLEVTYNKSSDIGVEGSMTKNLNNSTTGSLSNLFGLATQGAAPVPPGAGLYQVLGSDFQATLRAIATAGKTEVLSRPSILTRNSQPAIITVGQTIPLITGTRVDALGQQINTVTYTDIGIILRVTPFITADGMVEMIVSPEISSLTDQTITISTGVSAPVIAKRSADTVVVTPDMQTVVIGGLMQNNRTESTSKIPLLGDIPWLGNAFKHKTKTNTKTELIIFLTPHIVKEPSQLAALSTAEREKASFAPKAFPEDELNRFLDNLPPKDNASPSPANRGSSGRK